MQSHTSSTGAGNIDLTNLLTSQSNTGNGDNEQAYQFHGHMGTGSSDTEQANRNVVNTLLLDFQVDPATFANPVTIARLTQDIDTILRKHVPNLAKVPPPGISGLPILYYDNRGTVISVKMYLEGIVTVNVEFFLKEGDMPVLTVENQRELEQELKAKLSAKRSKLLPPIRRGAKIDQYLPTSDERLLEYDFDGVVFDNKSRFQEVQIFHSKSFGNVLVLDGLPNLAESDLVYTHALMNIPEYSYKDKTALILGGGDGALLHELLKEKPAFVTMVEIDEVVMDVCRRHMRSVCGDAMDSYKGDNYEIRVTDAVQAMKDYLADGHKFDYVIGDLTDAPLAQSNDSKIWDFLNLIVNLGVKLLNPGGKYLTHATGVSATDALEEFEKMLQSLDTKVTFNKTSTFVPSFLEGWVFYQISPAT